MHPYGYKDSITIHYTMRRITYQVIKEFDGTIQYDFQIYPRYRKCFKKNCWTYFLPSFNGRYREKMIIKNILVLYDGTPSSQRAFNSALKLAKKHEAKILIFTCIPDQAIFGFFKIGISYMVFRFLWFPSKQWMQVS